VTVETIAIPYPALIPVIDDRNQVESGMRSKPADLMLLQKIAAGSTVAYMEFYDKYSALLYSLAFKILKNSVAAEAVILEAFRPVWKAAATFPVRRSTPFQWMLALVQGMASRRMPPNRLPKC
jgi:hypothetical protein